MEPVSTFILAATFLAVTPITRRPEWDISKHLPEAELSVGSTTTFLLPMNAGGIFHPVTELRTDPSTPFQLLSLRELLKREVLAYSECNEGWNGPGTCAPTRNAIDSANRFVDAIPARLPLPRPMLSTTGEIGFYWDLEKGYAETSFDNDGVITFFSRTLEGEERYIEDIVINQINTNWFWETIGTMDLVVAAA